VDDHQYGYITKNWRGWGRELIIRIEKGSYQYPKVILLHDVILCNMNINFKIKFLSNVKFCFKFENIV